MTVACIHGFKKSESDGRDEIKMDDPTRIYDALQDVLLPMFNSILVAGVVLDGPSNYRSAAFEGRSAPA